MQPRSPRRPVIRAVRREIDPPRPVRKRRWRARLSSLLLFALLAGGGWYAWQHSQAPEEQPVVAVRSGAVQNSLDTDALIVRREQVVAAPVGGRVRRLTGEGERVRVSAPVVEIDPGGVAPPAGSPGGPAGAPPASSAASSPASSAAQREFDRLSAEIYQLVAVLNQAKYAGQAQKAAELQAQVDQLSRRQHDLLPELGSAAASRPAPAPVAAGPARETPSNPRATQVTTRVAGVVLFQTDGLESLLAPGDAERWTPSWLRSLPYPEVRQVSDQAVAAGEPLFKVVDDLDVDLLAVVPAARLTLSQRTILSQEGVSVRIPGQERAVKAGVRRMAEEGEELLLHLTLPLPGPEALRVRRMRVSLLLETYEGIIVPRAAIDVQGGATGVWVLTGGEYRFTPVQVIGGNRDEVAVRGDLAPDAKVLKQPSLRGS